MICPRFLLLLCVCIVSGPCHSFSGEENGREWLPEGEWNLEWADEFEAGAEVEKWYPLLGYNQVEFAEKEAKGIRWAGSTEETSHMYSAKTGHHWINEDGHLVLRIVCDKTRENELGPRVEGAYLLSGYPEKWDKEEPTGVKWAGKFVSPKEGPLYISASVRSDQVVGYSTWFAFWLFSETRAYNGNPEDGTEVDVVEIVKGKPDYMESIFNVANHWKQIGGSEAKQFNPLSNPPATAFVDVTDAKFHTYGIEWSQEEMKCYVDGKCFYTFTENIPSDPVDMLLLLTMEFQPNAWDPNQGDGRVEGPYVSDGPKMREMSRALVDFVRVYRKK